MKKVAWRKKEVGGESITWIELSIWYKIHSEKEELRPLAKRKTVVA